MTRGSQRRRMIEVAIMLAALAGVASMGLAASFPFIPIANNVMLVGGWFVMLAAGIRTLMSAVRWVRRARWKVPATIAFAFAIVGFVCLVLAGMFAVAMGMRVDESFSYRGATYYVQNEGFMDPVCVVYEQNGLITMREVQRYEERGVPDGVDDELAAALVDGTYGPTAD